MDVQSGLMYIGIAVATAIVFGIASMFAMQERSYEDAIAEQRKFPDDLLLGKKERIKEKKHKHKSGKKAKEKKEEKKEEKEEKDDKSDHVQFEENPQILPTEPAAHESVKGNKKRGKAEKIKPILVNKDEPVVIVTELSPSQPLPSDGNHFDVIQPKDDLELIRSHSKENLQHVSHSESSVNKSPKDTPTKNKKHVKESANKKKDEQKEEKKEAGSSATQQQAVVKEAKEQPKEIIVKETKEIVKETAAPVQQQQPPANKESKKSKKKMDILAQIGGERDGVNVSLLMPLVQKAELSRSEIQILIDQLLNKQMDNPLEHSEWTEGRADPVIKLKKQLAEKEKALTDEHEASIAFQTKLKELRAELNADKSRHSSAIRQMEETMNAKVTEVQTLQTRIQHILVSHAAEKQGYVGQIEQLQAKIKEDAAFIHKLQEDQGQSHGQMQQELLAQRKQLEAQFAQMRDNENALKGQLTQKHAEVQDLQNAHMSVTQELQVTVESSTAEIDMLRQQIGHMQDELMQAENQMHHYKEANDLIQDLHRQLEESHHAQNDMDHRIKNMHRHEQELQKQVNALQSELNVAKTEASESASLKSELNKAQSELMKLKSELSASQNEAKSEVAEITTLKAALNNKEEQLKNALAELSHKQDVARTYQAEANKFNADLTESRNELAQVKAELAKSLENNKVAQENLNQYHAELVGAQEMLEGHEESLVEIQYLKDDLYNKAETLGELEKELKQLRDKNESMASQLKERVESRENGIEEKAQKNSIQLLEHNNLLAQKEDQLSALKVELTNKDSQLSQLSAQVEALTSDVNKHNTLALRLEDDLKAQRSKNNDLRTKNWKMMEALSAAENRAKHNTEKSAADEVQKLKLQEQEATKALLQRIFPEIEVSEKSHDQWMKAFESRVHTTLNDLKKDQDKDNSVNPELEKLNKDLQDMVLHYKKIIYETEGMLNKLQSHIESEEIRWQAQLRQKETEVANLRVEVTGLRESITVNDKLQQKITELELRLSETQEEKKLNESRDRAAMFAAVEQLTEEKSRLSEELQIECSKRATLDAEVTKLRDLVEISETNLAHEKKIVSQLQQEMSQLKSDMCGVSSGSQQSTLNGPPAATDSSKSEPMVGSQSMIADLENTLLKNTELENCSVNETDDSVEVDTSSLTSKITSDTCHTTDNKIKANSNPLNGQKHKKHKKKRKGGSGKK